MKPGLAALTSQAFLLLKADAKCAILNTLGARHTKLCFNLMDPNWLYVYDAREPGDPIGGERGFKAIKTVQRYPPPTALPGPKFSVGWMCFFFASQYKFITSLAEGRPTRPDFVDVMKVQEVMEAGYISASETRWESLALD